MITRPVSGSAAALTPSNSEPVMVTVFLYSNHYNHLCQCSRQPLQGGSMNQQQSEFAERAMQQLRKVIDQCVENSATATAILGRRQVGRHIVVVRIIAEPDEGFSAPLASHASRPGLSSTVKPDYSKKTEHHNKNNQINRWHKPIFD